MSPRSPTPPPISITRDIAQRHGLRKLVLIYQIDGDQLGYTSYGENKAQCGKARKLGDRLYAEALDFLGDERMR